MNSLKENQGGLEWDKGMKPRAAIGEGAAKVATK
jgi:hypothetical protein